MAISFFIHTVGVFDQKSFWPYLLPACPVPTIMIGGAGDTEGVEARMGQK